MVRINQGLQLECAVSSWKGQCSGRCFEQKVTLHECAALLEDGFDLMHPAMLHSIQISCSLESKIIEGQKTDKGVFHIKEKIKKSHLSTLEWMNRACYGLTTVVLFPRIESLRTNSWMKLTFLSYPSILEVLRCTKN
jgi:hypothetical protein